MINQSSESQQDAPGEKIDLLSGIASDLKLEQKKAPAINEQIAKIVHGLKEVTPKTIFFLSAPIKSLYLVKLLTEVSASKVHAIPRN